MKFHQLLISSSFFVLTACGGSGGADNISSISVPESSNSSDTIAPDISFDSDSLTLVSGASIAVTLSTSDNVGIASGPMIDCTNGGVFSDNVFTAPNVTVTTEVVCTASVSDAAGNSSSSTLTVNVTPPASQAMFTLNGSAFKGLILGGIVSVVDANNPNIILAEGVTSQTDGAFDLPITYGSSFDGTYLKITVSGGNDTQMICDAAQGCSGTMYGQPISIDENFSLSAVVQAPALNENLTINLNIISDLAASLIDATVDTVSLDAAVQKTLRVFGFQGNDLTQIAPMDLTQIDPVGTVDNARLTFLSGGLLDTLLVNGNNAGIEYEKFRTTFKSNSGEIVVTESTDDPAIISLKDIYENAATLRSVITSSSQNTIVALDNLDSNVSEIGMNVQPDRLTNLGSWVLMDSVAPILTFSPSNVTVFSGESIVVPASILDEDPNALLSSAVCDGGTYDIATQTYSAPTDLHDRQSFSCNVTAVDASDNVGTGIFTISVTVLLDTELPRVTFNPALVSVISGQSAEVILTASDNVALQGDISVTCTNGGSFSGNVFTAPIITTATSSVCIATATDTSGNIGTAELMAEIVLNPDTVLPEVSFSPASITVESGETATSILTASDNNGLAGEVSVSCTNGGSFSNNVFVAPAVTAAVTSICTARATDFAGNVGTAELTAQITYVPDTELPVITLGFSGDLLVEGGASAPLDFTVTDNVEVASIDVSCDTSDVSYENGQILAEFRATTYSDRCTITAVDSSGNTKRLAFPVRVTVPADEGPRITFNPDTMSLGPNRTGFSALDVFDLHGSVADGPHITCTEGVTYVDGAVTAPDTSTDLNTVCTATATDDKGLVGTGHLTVNVLAQASDPVVRGVIKFNTYGNDSVTGGLDTDKIIPRLGRGLTVEVLNNADEVIAKTSSDEAGFYEVALPQDEEIRLRVLAEIQQADAPDMPVRVEERFFVGVRSFVGDSSLPTGLITEKDLDLGTNSALNILDVIYQGMQKFTEVDPTLVFPKLDIRYTESGIQPSSRYPNNPRNTNSHYTNLDVNNSFRRIIYIASEEITDNIDYWDRHVIAHLWTHYIEDSFGRYDSPGQYVGGEFTDIDAAFDPRVAFSEGFANAMAGIILDDPVYIDTYKKTEGNRRFDAANVMNLESGDSGNRGWFNVRSIQNVIYDLYDDENETYMSAGFLSDEQSLGLSGVFDALRHPAHKDTPFFTTIFSFREAIDLIIGEREIGTFVEEDIYAREAEATRANNDGGDPANLPIYHVWKGEELELCSNLSSPEQNGYNLGIIKNVAFTVPSPSVTSSGFEAVSAVPFGASEPEMIIYRRGVEVARTIRDDPYLDNITKLLEPDDYILSVFDHDNFLGTTNNGSICMLLTIDP